MEKRLKTNTKRLVNKDDLSKPITCNVNGCTERYRCDLKETAQRCAVFRAIMVKGMRIER